MEHGNRDKMDEVGDESSNGEPCNEKKEQHSHQDTYRVNSGSNSTPPQPDLFLVTYESQVSRYPRPNFL